MMDGNTFVNTYGEFVDLYEKSGHSDLILLKIVKDNWETLEMEEEKNISNYLLHWLDMKNIVERQLLIKLQITKSIDS